MQALGAYAWPLASLPFLHSGPPPYPYPDGASQRCHLTLSHALVLLSLSLTLSLPPSVPGMASPWRTLAAATPTPT